MSHIQVTFRDIDVDITDQKVFIREPNKYYYEVRHADDDWEAPATIEKLVDINFFGTIICCHRSCS